MAKKRLLIVAAFVWSAISLIYVTYNTFFITQFRAEMQRMLKANSFTINSDTERPLASDDNHGNEIETSNQIERGNKLRNDQNVDVYAQDKSKIDGCDSDNCTEDTFRRLDKELSGREEKETLQPSQKHDGGYDKRNKDRQCFDRWKQVVVVGDLHGDLQNFILLLQATSLIDNNYTWVAPAKTLLIQMGDVVDKGPDSFPIYQFLRKLRTVAKNRGSEIVQLIGNHEAMNMCGMFHHVHPEEIQKHYKRSVQVMRDAWSPEGLIGKDVRGNFHAAYKVEDIVFVHAGILPRYAEFSFRELKQRVIGQIDEDGCLASRNSNLGVNMERLAWERQDKIEKEDLLGELGPLWTRLLAMKSDSVSCPMLEESLKLLNSTRMFVGHTPTASGQVTTRCSGKLVMVDTAISRHMANNPRAVHFDENCTAWEVHVTHQLKKRNGGNRKSRRLNVDRRKLFDHEPKTSNDDTKPENEGLPEKANHTILNKEEF